MNLPWTLRIDGADLVIEGGVATAFGGASDPQDDGQTASGISTRAHPDLVACSLPMTGFAGVHSTAGSPIPRLPWLTVVEVYEPTTPGEEQNQDGSASVGTGSASVGILCPLIDIGPSLNVDGGSHALDLTVAAARLFASQATANNFERRLDYRIKGGARYLEPPAPASPPPSTTGGAA